MGRFILTVSALAKESYTEESMRTDLAKALPALHGPHGESFP